MDKHETSVPSGTSGQEQVGESFKAETGESVVFISNPAGQDLLPVIFGGPGGGSQRTIIGPGLQPSKNETTNTGSVQEVEKSPVSNSQNSPR